MINLLHGIGNEVAAPKKNGKKTKSAKLIPVQTTAKASGDNSGCGPSTIQNLSKSLREGF